jgi:hypothetical protein
MTGRPNPSRAAGRHQPVGPVPQWQGGLLKQMIDTTITSDVRRRMSPLYMRNGLVSTPFDYDAVLRREVKAPDQAKAGPTGVGPPPLLSRPASSYH